MRLSGRRALVTGATGGIGRAIAEALAAQGASVVLTGRDAGRGADVVDRIDAAGGRAWFLPGDLSEGASRVTRLAHDAAERAGGTIDILVNNAARLVAAQSLFDATEAEINQTLAMNVTVPFLLTAALAKPMIEAGGGAIVNVGSLNGLRGMAIAALYGASKAGLHSLTQSFAAELAPRGVRVNTVAPGPTVTELTEQYRPIMERLASDGADQRPGTAAEVADAVVFLASDDARHIHGITLPVDGGSSNIQVTPNF